MKKALEFDGAGQVVVIEDPTDAIKTAESSPPFDTILTDWIMKPEDALEVIAIYRERGISVRTILLTDAEKEVDHFLQLARPEDGIDHLVLGGDVHDNVSRIEALLGLRSRPT